MPRHSDTRTEQPIRCTGHGRPVSRRDFLARGLQSGVGIVAAPTIWSLLRAPSARAQTTCQVGVGGSGMIPFLCLDLAGGASIAGSNLLVGGPGGQLDLLTAEGYSKLGLPSDMTPDNAGQVNTELGIAFHADSAFLAGILSKTSDTTRANVNGTLIAARSDNDTDNNPHNPMYGINKAGANGDLVTLIGSRSSDSGGNSEAPGSMVDPAVRPTKVSSGRDATGLVDTGKLIDLLDQTDAAAVARASEQISDLKVALANPDPQVAGLIRCGFAQTTDLIARFGDPDVLNPELDLDILGGPNAIFTAQELDQSRFRKTAAVMKLVIEGYAGAGTIEQGGYDYHDSTRATGEVRDFLAGQMMGAMLEFAARRTQPLMLYVISDGSVASDGVLDNSADGRGKGIWKGDNSSTAATFFLAYDPNGRPQLTRPESNQLGYFRPSGSVETAANRVAANVALLAESIVLNYLALHDRAGEIDQVLPGHGLGAAAERDALITLQPIRTQA
jgi:hypothetical protein